MHCKMGIKKTYRLEVEDCDPLQAVYARESCPNRMQVQAQTLNMCLQNFPGGLDEISMVLHPDKVIVKSYVDNKKTEEALMRKLLLTEMTLNPNDFEVYDFNTNKKVTLTFCLKEMKAILSFCEKQPQPLSFYMDVEGKPVLVSVGMANTFEADFVLATLIDPEEDESQATASQSSTRNYPASAISPGMSGASPSLGYTNTPDIGGTASPSLTSYNKRRSDSQLATPPAKRSRMVEHEEEDEDDDEDDMMLWGKDLQTNVIDGADDSDVMSS
eukprot:TRINITY_DN9565_c0_g1_i2.p1 TRINITY_DN9565_c0_g1~~TRINITY_DN9565_c0_g1_i2.p1  ORF type:complete len:272 (+),score=65.10 TRINITY_DN9565_c0_g1_i2:153-968(+)